MLLKMGLGYKTRLGDSEKVTLYNYSNLCNSNCLGDRQNVRIAKSSSNRSSHYEGYC